MCAIGRPGDLSYASLNDAFTRGKKREKAGYALNASANHRSTRV